MPTYAEQVAELTTAMAQQAPAELLAPFAAEQAALAAAGLPAGIAQPGTGMPDGALLDVHGTATSLAATRDGRPAVVVFYRGSWCPFCNLALRLYQEQLLPALTERGVTLIAVSPERPDGSLSLREKQELGFAVLSDPGNQLAAALGIRTEPSEEAKRSQAAMGINVAKGNADGTAGLPMPTVALVDAAGVLRWLDVRPDYSTRTEPADIIAAVDRLG
ncbi:peroxiredoxin [Crossiella equi]|uniref:thioredoxin-dependent peroxiredoxin n=1 Tax=Crossiella equi TaxID=130796 RepID=A0ABS5A788_9PSEU|nr:peroxiredoxin-like family protein [Crossiella equi]MBP2472089.1 peroxiredoxin [Crossiella equi]